MSGDDRERREATQAALEQNRKLRADAARIPELRTRRERIATSVLTGFAMRSLNGNEDPGSIARASLKYADALLREIELHPLEVDVQMYVPPESRYACCGAPAGADHSDACPEQKP